MSIAEFLWARVRAAFARADAIFTLIAALPENLRRPAVARLSMLEAVVRKLLFAEAVQLTPNAHPPAARLPHRLMLKHPAGKDASAPRLLFALALPPDPRLVLEARAPRIRALWDAPRQRMQVEAPRLAVQITPPRLLLARRIEALRRVLEKPAPHARRLARALARGARRHPELTRRYASAPARVYNVDPEDARLHLDCLNWADAALQRAHDTG